MYKRIYSKTGKIEEDVKDIILKNKGYSLKDLLYLFAIPGAKLGWKGQNKKFKVVARNDNFIIIARPYNPKRTLEYSILDLEYMECNHDNYYNKYDYSNKDECIEALIELQENRNKEKKLGYNCDGLQVSRRGTAKIKDVVSEIWIEVKINRQNKERIKDG